MYLKLLLPYYFCEHLLQFASVDPCRTEANCLLLLYTMKWHWTAAILIALLTMDTPVFCQTRADLEKQRDNIKVLMSSTSKKIEQTQIEQTNNVQKLKELDIQIATREQTIADIKNHMTMLDSSIIRSSEVVIALDRDMLKLKQNYEQMLRYTYKLRIITSNKLFYILSASSLNESITRWHLLRRYEAYRKKQFSLIRQTHNALMAKIATFEKRRKEKETLLLTEASNKTKLANEMAAKEKIIKKLKKDELKQYAELRTQEKTKKIVTEQLQAAIEVEAAVKRALARSTPPTSSYASIADANVATETKQLQSSFTKNKGKLPWPVTGSISRTYGKQQHPDQPNLQVDYPGIDITAPKNATARAVFEGEVASVFFVPGSERCIIVKHGDYFTSYSHIEDAFVKQGDKVKTNQEIGRIHTTSKGTTELHFQVWQNKNRLNPTSWIERRQ